MDVECQLYALITPFYVGVLSIHEFGIHGGGKDLEPISTDTEEQLKVLESQNYMWIFDCTEDLCPNPCIVNGSIVSIGFDTIHGFRHPLGVLDCISRE